MGVDSWCERKGEREKICVPELDHPFDAQYLFCCPFPWLWWKLFPQSLSLSDSSYEKRRIDPHTVSTRKGRREGGGALAFLSGIEDPLSSRWVMVDGEDDGTLVG